MSEWLDDLGCDIENNFHMAMNWKIKDCCFKTRLENCLLYQLELERLDQVLEYSEQELLRTPNFGRKSLDELKEFLAKYGLKLMV